VESNYNHIDDLIGKYLSGEAAPDETQFVESWLTKSEDNRRYFDQMKTIFSRAAKVAVAQQFDADAAWNRVKTKLHKNGNAKTVQLKPDTNYNLYLKIAASVIMVLGLGFFTYRAFNPAVTVVEVVADKKTEADTLPDGSGVFLNKETKLAYEFDKKKNTHIVKLKGEAYFNINSNDNKQFIVKADEVFIKDIGTSFNVRAYPESNTIEVVVEEGEVMLYTESDSGVYLGAGGKGVYNKKTHKFTIEEPEPNATAYKTRFFIFSDTDLNTVVESVNAVYNQKIKISENLKACRLTVTFNNESTDDIADVIAETLGLTVKRSGQEVLLEGPGCGQ
jgi:ferric-dicitrate binding protein FerR (iron transport regulator)